MKSDEKNPLKSIEPLLVFDPVLCATTWFYCGCSLSEVVKDIEARKRVKLDMESCSASRGDDYGTTFVVPLEENDLYVVHVRRKRDINTLAHELIHNVFNIFKSHDVIISHDNQEMFAKYHSFLMEKTKKALRG